MKNNANAFLTSAAKGSTVVTKIFSVPSPSFLPPLRLGLLAAAIILPLSPLPLAATPVEAAPGSCWSLLQSRFGPQIEKSVNEADPCKKLPGLDHKEKFEVKSMDVCSAPGGVQITAHADIACKSHGVLQATIKGQLEASVTVDVGACRITDSHVGISGPIGDLISSVGGMQELARGFAQAKISEICGK